MAQDEFFSFGDEDLAGETDRSELTDDHLSGSPAIALADPPDAVPLGEFGNTSSAAERVRRPRGDSERASSERRRPSSRRTQLLACLALLLLAIVVVRGASSALSGAPSAAPSRDVAGEVQSPTEAIVPSAPEDSGAEQLRASRERAVERQQVRQRRAKTRRRARRSRDRRAARQERRADAQRDQAASQAPEPAAPEYIPPAPEAAPEYDPSPPPSGETGLQDGASSPEFGL
jgi:hypothetical protein